MLFGKKTVIRPKGVVQNPSLVDRVTIYYVLFIPVFRSEVVVED
jgi:hypothetical protein